MRKQMSPHKDKQVFRNTATRSKAININPVIMRGGIRL